MQYNKPFDQTNTAAGYVNGNPATNTAGSIPCAEGLEYPQREIVALIAAAQTMGLDAPSNTDLAQMLKAIRSGLLTRFPATGSPDAIAIAPQPVYVGLVEGMRFRVKVPGNGSNTSTTPALAINSLSAPIVRGDGSAVAKGDLVAGRVVEFEIDAALNARIGGAFASITQISLLLEAAVTTTQFSQAVINPSIPNNSYAPITFSDPSTADFINNGASGFKVVTPGLYEIEFSSAFQTGVNVTGSNDVHINLAKNDQTGLAFGETTYYADSAGTWLTQCQCSTVKKLVKDDVILPLGAVSAKGYTAANNYNSSLTFTNLF